MEQENITSHPVAKEILRISCFLTFMVGVAAILLVAVGINHQTRDLKKINEWCTQTAACAARPTLFGPSVLRVSQIMQTRASALINSINEPSSFPSWVLHSPYQLELEPTPRSSESINRIAKKRTSSK